MIGNYVKSICSIKIYFLLMLVFIIFLMTGCNKNADNAIKSNKSIQEEANTNEPEAPSCH